jgi:dTDP-4-amino-4,6-dideoxygalactose transaminase
MRRGNAVTQAVTRVLESGWYILGKEVAAFEEEFAAYCGSGFSVGVANGTDAITLALMSCGIKPGDEVITVSHTASATAAGIERAGAAAVLADIDPQTYTISVASARTLISSKTKALVPVHLYGHPADMDAVTALAREHGLTVIEDCAQAHGAMADGRKVGTLGDAAAFSFYPTKNLPCAGDGGMIIFRDPTAADTAKALRQYGWKERFFSEAHGMNSRLDEMQAAVLRTMLPHLDEDNAARRAIAQRYFEGIHNPFVTRPFVRKGAYHVYHQFVLECGQRDSLRAFLKSRGIATAVHYPWAVHMQPAYRDCRRAVSLGVTETAVARILSLPMHPAMNDEAVARVVDAVNAWEP